MLTRSRARSRARPVLLAVASGGGHWVQLQRLSPAFAGAEVHYATPDRTTAAQLGDERLYVYPDANKDTPLRLIACLVRIAWIVVRVRPDVVVSTGAAGGLIAIRLARMLGARTMFIDSIANARELSVSGRLALGVADRVLCQWPRVAELTGAEYRGAVL